MNYYEHHLGDYLRDTAHLSMLEDGAYRRMLDVYYVKEQPLPAEPRDVHRLVRASTKPERDAVLVVLREFFTQTPEGWRHKRCDSEIGRYKDKQAKARRSADARWNPTRQASEGNANASPTAHANDMRTHSEGNAPQSPVTSNQTPISVAEATGVAAAVPSTKDELWKAGKSLLSQAGMPAAQCGSFIGKLVKDHGDEAVLDAVRRSVVEQPADPASFLKATCQAATGGRRPKATISSRHSGFDQRNYEVSPDGSIPP